MKKREDAGSPQLTILLVLLAALLTVIVSGCSPKSTPPGAVAAGGTLERTGYVFLRWEEGLALMVWHDIPESYMGHGSGSTTDPVYRLQGHAEAPDGRRFDLEVQTSDGKAGEFMIDGSTYDLSEGTLFIVTTSNGKADVKQLERDLSGVQPDRESIVAFAKGDPDLTRFIGDTTELQ